MAQNVKTVLGVPIANVKTFCGVPIANCKTIMGVDNTGSANWWEAGGATGIVGAYMAKGAADFATSKINLANPGTHNAADGSTPPSWASGDGWTFNSSSYLTTDITITKDYTALIQVNTIGAGQPVLFGLSDGGGLFRLYADFANECNFGNGGQTAYAPGFASAGNVGMAGLTAIRNGASDGAIAGGGYSGTSTEPVWIGGQNAGGSFANGANFKCTAFAIYNNTLTSGQYAAVAAAMAAL